MVNSSFDVIKRTAGRARSAILAHLGKMIPLGSPPHIVRGRSQPASNTLMEALSLKAQSM
jgi:hypothetical protein